MEHIQTPSGQPPKESWVLFHLHPCQKLSIVDSYTWAPLSWFLRALLIGFLFILLLLAGRREWAGGRGCRRSLLHSSFSTVSTVIDSTARLASLPFIVSQTPQILGFYIASGNSMDQEHHLVSSICMCQGPLLGLQWQYGPQTSTWSSAKAWAMDQHGLREKCGPWRSFEEVKSNKWAILHLEHPVTVQSQDDCVAGQLVRGWVHVNSGLLHSILLTVLGNNLSLHQLHPSLHWLFEFSFSISLIIDENKYLSRTKNKPSSKWQWSREEGLHDLKTSKFL